MSFDDIYPPLPSKDMQTTDYDVNEDRRIDYAERLANEDRTIIYTAQDIKSHVEDRTIHVPIDDEHPSSETTFSGHKISDLLFEKADIEHRHYAIEVDTDTSDFENLLGTDDDTVQKALNTLDKAVRLDETLKCGIVTVKN